MASENQTTFVAAANAKPPTDWRALLAEWIFLLSIVAFAGLAWKLHEASEAIKSHDKIVEVWMRHNHANTLVTERALAHLEERQAAKQARELKLRTGSDDLELPSDEDNHTPHR